MHPLVVEVEPQKQEQYMVLVEMGYQIQYEMTQKYITVVVVQRVNSIHQVFQVD